MKLFLKLLDASGRKKNKMADQKQEIPYISIIISRSCMLPTTISTLLSLRNSNELFSILCGASGSKKSKMAAHKQEILHISTILSCWCMIPTTIFTFLRLRYSIELFPTLFSASGSKKSKMAAHKQEILIFQLLYHVAAWFQQQYPRFWGWGIPFLLNYLPTLCDVSGSEKFKMAAHKQGILISQPVYQ